MNKAVILTGIKHCGKSALGKRMAQELNCDFYDTDNLILQLTGKTAREIYTENGSEALLFSETAACRFLAEIFSAGKYKYSETVPAVIATGGGICNNTEAIDILRPTGTFVFLNISEKLAADRIVAEITYKNGEMQNLPAYISCEKPENENDVRNIFSIFYKKRTESYGTAADIIWTPDDVPIETNAEQLIAELKTAGIIPSAK